MGYTHYWQIAAVSQHSKRFKVAVSEMAKVVRQSPVPLAGPMGTGKPQVSASKIAFNGVTPLDHETFVFPEANGFCKTAQKPYDIVVTACLAIAKDVFGNEIEVSSDGNSSDWTAGIALASKVLGRPIANPLVDVEVEEDVKTPLGSLIQQLRAEPQSSGLHKEIQGLRESLGHDMINKVIDYKDNLALIEKIKKEDPQAAQLYRDVLMHLAEKLTPTDPNVEQALNRVMGMLSRGKSWDAGMLRNSVFKAADLLGMKLPSGSF